MQTKNTRQAFLWITDLLERLGITYKLTGAMAARFYGSTRELADIDLEVNKVHLSTIAQHVKPYIIFGPAPFRDENWNIELMTIQYEGQEIDIAESGGYFRNAHTGVWEQCIEDFVQVNKKEIFGKVVKVESKASLIAIEQKHAREVDLLDIKAPKLQLTSDSVPDERLYISAIRIKISTIRLGMLVSASVGCA